MNLFFLHVNPEICAQEHCDKHVVKMLLETVQMLYTVHHLCNSDMPDDAYKKVSMVHHPTVIWVGICFENYNYASTLGMCLSKEYTHRYNKIHSCDTHIRWLHNNIPNFIQKEFPYEKCKKQVVFSYNQDIQNSGMTPVPLAMPDDVKQNDTIYSYRSYYIVHKKYFTKWTSRPIPNWFTFYNIRNFFQK